MRLVWGARNLAVVAEKKGVDVIDASGESKRCEAERDHASKAYSHAAAHARLPYVALAARGGAVQVLDVRTGKTALRLDLGEDCGGIGFGPKSLFAATRRSGQVVEWDLESGKELARFTADEDGLSCLAVSQDGDEAPLVATARTGISVWASGKRVSRYSGHDANVISMVFLRGGALATLAEHDRSISIWPAQVKKAKHPVLIFTCGQALSSIKSGDRLLDGDEGALLSLSEATGGDAKVFVWRIPSLSEDGKVTTVQPSTTIPSPSSNEGILGSDFGSKKGSIVFLLNSPNAVLPVLSSVSLFADGEVAKQITLGSASQSSADVSVEEGFSKTGTGDKGKKAELKRLEAGSLVNSGSADVKRARAASNVSGGEDDRPMLARLSEFAHRLEETSAFPSVAQAQATRMSAPSSLSVALDQALQTGDKEKIEAVLQTTDPSIVSQTVQRLSPSRLPVFVKELGIRLQGKPGRAGLLLVWLNAVVEHHGTALASDPAARDALRHVYSVADARVQTFDRLLRLKGRLDVLLARSGAAGSSGRAAAKGPLVVVKGSSE